jgi:hypothetical protein
MKFIVGKSYRLKSILEVRKALKLIGIDVPNSGRMELISKNIPLVCEEIIDSHIIIANGRKWHKDCFVNNIHRKYVRTKV